MEIWRSLPCWLWGCRKGPWVTEEAILKKLEIAKKETLPQSLRKEHSAANSEMYDLQSYRGIHSCCLKLPKSLVIGYSGPRKPIQDLWEWEGAGARRETSSDAQAQDQPWPVAWGALESRLWLGWDGQAFMPCCCQTQAPGPDAQKPDKLHIIFGAEEGLFIAGSSKEKGMAPYSNGEWRTAWTAWRIPWPEELVGLQSMGLQRVRHGWTINTFHARRTGWLTPKRWVSEKTFLLTNLCIYFHFWLRWVLVVHMGFL